MRATDFLKAKLRPTFVYRPFLRRKANRQEQLYLQIREEAYRRLPDAFAAPGYLSRSKELLQQSWSGPRTVKSIPQEMRLFIIDQPGMVGPWFEEELARHFEVVVFSMSRHKVGFAQGMDDLISFSMGIDPDDRLRKPMPSGSMENLMEWRDRLQGDILTAISQAHGERPIDLCFAYGSHTEFEPETFHRIRKLNIPVALWWLDEKHAFKERPFGHPNGQEPLIGSCDLHLTNSSECIRWYMAKAVAAYYFPQAIDPEIYHPRDVKRDIPVSFIGAAYGQRFGFIQRLKEAEVPVECFGPGWENGVIDDLVEIFCRSRINLGMGFTGLSRQLTCIKERDFQVPATGSLYLTTYDPELARLFDVGREILCYRDEMDCVEQIRYQLERPEEAEVIGKTGRERCLREHTWRHRMVGLLKWMGILAQEA